MANLYEDWTAGDLARALHGVGLAIPSVADLLTEAANRLVVADCESKLSGVGGANEKKWLEIASSGKKIMAIKTYREDTGSSLRDAKDAIEALMAKHGIG
jgi:ribosomal protein L7/L12